MEDEKQTVASETEGELKRPMPRIVRNDDPDEDGPSVRLGEDEPKRAIVTRGEPGVDYLGLGRRKTATARIRLRRGSGQILINGRKVEDYFGMEEIVMVRNPFEVTETVGHFNVKARVCGGGLSGQAGAVRLAIARALCKVDLELRPMLKKAGLLVRDPRMVERKKYGQKGARKRFQFSKR